MDIDWVKNDYWVIEHQITPKEKFLLYITACSANIHDPISISNYWYEGLVGYNKRRLITQPKAASVDIVVLYNDVIEALREIIRRESNVKE